MEQLIVNVPERKSALIKELLLELGATIEQNTEAAGDYKTMLSSVSVWTDEELKIVEESRKAFESMKPEQW